MEDLIRQMLLGQYEASLAMLHQSVDECPDDAWEALLARRTARWAAYHALVFAACISASASRTSIHTAFTPRAAMS